MSSFSTPKGLRSVLTGSVFLMATSAIGPGFITQTTVFTQQLTTSFGFVIFCSVILDIIIQLNLWRVLSVSGLRVQDLANQFLPGSGYLLTVFIVLGGLAFNIGNVAGAALGMQVMAGAELWLGVVISAGIALFIFWYKNAGKALDLFTKLLGMVMIMLMAYIAFSSSPPVVETLHHTVYPERVETSAIFILVGGTVGGYISFAGIHRLLDAGVKGETHLVTISQSSIKAIVLASVMRILLFLAALGVVVSGVSLDSENPAASVFQFAAGEIGYRIFGVVFWCASITSIVGSAYTSVSFLRTINAFFEKNYKAVITFFILFSVMVFLILGKPVNILLLAGAVNAFVLPLALAIVLMASIKQKFVGNYKHPLWLQITGWSAVLVLTVMSIKTVISDLNKLWD